jgi:hypothetical protein
MRGSSTDEPFEAEADSNAAGQAKDEAIDHHGITCAKLAKTERERARRAARR